jgi:hypothetical protein
VFAFTIEVECSYRERIPFVSFSLMNQSSVEVLEESKSGLTRDNSDEDLERLAAALRLIKLRDVEKNPGPLLP